MWGIGKEICSFMIQFIVIGWRWCDVNVNVNDHVSDYHLDLKLISRKKKFNDGNP